jgi:tRNA 5-methylaminomethyl-2-thiouridine biosynthesis bifunctional protein
MTNALPSPTLTWLPQRVPYSERFGDVYRSREGAVAETRHVFLAGCGLPEAWQDSDLFVVGETGFGTGLNFLATTDAWRRTRPPQGRLHYIAVEGYPLSHDELKACAERFPELRHAAQSLLRVYLSPQPGFQRLFLDDGRIVLTLLFGDVLTMLEALEAQVDVWFLDGFSPDKNPDMWRSEVLGEVARLSKVGTRLATYTAAGDVRRQLTSVGFDVTKAPGFGAKAEMTRATFRGPPRPTTLPPWFAPAPTLGSRVGEALIVGAGLAGTHAAYALRRRGWKTTIIDRHDAIAEEASGNSVGVLMPRLTAGPSIDGRFYANAWRLGLDVLEELADAGHPLSRDRCGVLQLGVDEDDSRLRAIAQTGAVPEPYLFEVDAAEASEIAGFGLSRAALYFPQGGWLNPKLLCKALAKGSTLRLSSFVAGLRRNSGFWEAIDSDGATIATADIVVLANAMSATVAQQLEWLPLAARRGQISFLDANAHSAKLRTVLGYGGYVTPASKGRHCIGATFDWTEDAFGAQAVLQDDHRRNFAELAAALPTFAQSVSGETAVGRAAIRCTTPDHLPLAGPVPDQAAYLRDFSELRHGHPWARFAPAQYQTGLYVLAGLGSRGLVNAPMAAEILACHVTGEPWPAERDLVTALHAGRFLVRDLKRLRV